MAQLFKNNAFSSLAAALNNTATTLTVTTGHGDRFPAVTGADFFMLTLQDSSNNVEIVKVTARTAGADSMTIARAQEGFTARSWNLGDVVELRVTALALNPLSVFAGAATAQTMRDAMAAPSRTGGDASGTWAINISGNAATATTAETATTAGTASAVAWSGVTSKPSTRDGYGITDVPTTNGTGASGTWGINITGNAASVTNGVYNNGSTYSINISGSASSASSAVTLSSGFSNWATTGTVNGVVGMLGWKNYGNGHVIFDASAGTAPNGAGINNTNPTSGWSASYPTLMGWNGSQTYGVRVDSSRVADVAVTANKLAGDAGSAPSYSCRAWVNFNGAGTAAIRSSANISSVARNGVGDYTINFATGMPDANYAITGTATRGSYNAGNNPGGFGLRTQPTSSSFRVCTSNGIGTNEDSAQVDISIFR